MIGKATRTAWLASAIGLWVSFNALANAQQSAIVGSNSCATSTCHGGVSGQRPAWNSSLSTWAARDPHAGAGLLLLDDDSKQIVNRLLDPADRDSTEAFHQVLRTRCISCHATVAPEQTQPDGKIDLLVLAEGVSCEACHGPAEDWLAPHLQPQWAGPSRFEGTSMRDTESIVGRAETCARCHIGSRSDDGLVRDMNHDLIAAGHPALRFDLLIYNENLPHHWADDSQVETEFDESALRLRNVSRAINLAAAAELSSERAEDHLADPEQVPWPEFADYDCFACHQTLSFADYRLPSDGGSDGVSDGLPMWNAWHVLNEVERTKDQAAKALRILAPQNANARTIKAATAELAKKFRQLATDRMDQQYSPEQTIKRVTDQLDQALPDWHQAAVVYLQLDAAVRDLAANQSAERDAAMRDSIERIERLLRFDPDRNAGQPPRYHSPARFDPEAFRRAVQQAFGDFSAAIARPANALSSTAVQRRQPSRQPSMSKSSLQTRHNPTSQP